MSKKTAPQFRDSLADAIEAFALEFDISLAYASLTVAGRSTYYDDLRAGNRGNSDKRIAVFAAIEDETEKRRGKAAGKGAKADAAE